MLREEGDDGIKLDIIMKEPIVFTQDGQIEVKPPKIVTDEERQFECTVCHKTFKRRSHLKEHMITHSGVRAYKCDICDKYIQFISLLSFQFKVTFNINFQVIWKS